MDKNQVSKSRNWQKKLIFFLSAQDRANLSLSGVEPGGVAPALLRAAIAGNGPLAAALPDLNAVDRIVEELEPLMDEAGHKLRILVLPECGRGKMLYPEQESRRARALDSLLRERFDLVLGSVHALTAPAPPPDVTKNAALTLKPGMELPLESLVEKLVKLDYDDEFEASVTGEFARRGGIVDIYSPAADYPCRVEFFGDTIESLRKFSPETRRSTGTLEEYEVIGRSGITAGGAADGDAFDYLAGRDFRLLRLYPEQCFELLQKYSGAVAAERFDQISTQYAQAGKLQDFYDSAAGALHPGVPHADVAPPLIERAAIPISPEARAGAAALARQILKERLKTALDGTVVFLVHDTEDLPILKKWCTENDLDDPRLTYAVSPVEAGFSLLDTALFTVTLRELVTAGFARPGTQETEEPTPAVPAAPPVKMPEFSLADLDEGDYCVHLDHGIGIFRGIKTLTDHGVSREVLAIEYQDGQVLYVPLLQAHKVSRYLGAPGHVRLHRLGAARWGRDKESARKSVRSYAADMLRLQAMRQHIPGIAYPPDNAESRAFLRAFPFTDTPDQVRSTDEIRSDMESTRPMDRLLCGDVGYGKTEIAMRAVFKAVSNGYQAAILAPTTVLAQQHFLSFRERFAEYPFNIEVLSRFRTPAEQTDIMRRLVNGGIDIIIGTHRLCGSEVRFKNLGLVVIDEEQRFGVNHKERLRRFRAEVDVLTMSATPIPRTLYLAMAGARDLSTLMTAPKLRLPVKTIIAPEENELIASAIRAELARGGQVYYLYNRVQTIQDKADRLRALVPEARFGVAHGQMHESELEQVMTAFLERKIDCLVCSTIIESGLDIPNANTMMIERADRFGLAELYQLRGRVGRWKRQAYAYLLLPRDQLVSTDARKRLSAIRRCSNLGAGFQLALHDLEIRGSGNILGSEQSGHLNSIGFDLYCQLLKQEVAQLRGEAVYFRPEVEMGIDFISFSLNAPPGMIAASFPPEYIGGERLRMDAYRRLSSLQNEAALEDFAAELTDRFGTLPEQVKNLLAVIRLRLLAAEAGYEQFSVADGRVLLRNPGGTVYRDAAGKVPVLDYRDTPALRMAHLLSILREAVRFNQMDKAVNTHV